MKFNKLAALLLASGFATAAMAGGQGTGVINFSGEIIDAPCTLLESSATQNIRMGQVSNKALADGKIASTLYPINIELVDCSIDTLKEVSVTFDGAADPKNAELIAINGSAKGAGIRLSRLNNELVELGKAEPFMNLVAGNGNIMRFNAQLQGLATGVAIVPGEFTAISTFALEYK